MSDKKNHCQECDFHWANGHSMSCSEFGPSWCGITFTDDQVATIKAGGFVFVADSSVGDSPYSGYPDGAIFKPGFRAFAMKLEGSMHREGT